MADKYQKSAKVSHHYASYIYEKEREKLVPPNKKEFKGTKSIVEDVVLNSVGLKKIQNISKNIPIDEINRLIPITTVLHPVNDTGNVRNVHARQLADRRVPSPNLDQLNKSIGEMGLKSTTSKKPLNLAELLKRTEMKPTKSDSKGKTGLKLMGAATPTTTVITTTTEAVGMQFAQLESYKHFVNSKNLQELLKHVKCNSATDCGRRFTVEQPSDPVEYEDRDYETEQPMAQQDSQHFHVSMHKKI